MKRTLSVIGLLTGAAVLLSSAPIFADATIIQHSDPADYARTRIMNEGTAEERVVLRQTDGEHTNEQTAYAFDADNPKKGVVVWMSTADNLDGCDGDGVTITKNTGPAIYEYPDGIKKYRVQLAFAQIELVNEGGTTKIKVVCGSHKYVTERVGEDGRVCHHPDVQAIGDGLYAVHCNWDRNNETNTDRYLMVLDQEGNRIPLTTPDEEKIQLYENGTSARFVYQDNDNCSSHQAGGGSWEFIYRPGDAMLVTKNGCNGNGRDDVWTYINRVTCAEDKSTCEIVENSQTSVEPQEQRCRGSEHPFWINAKKGEDAPDLTVGCCTSGNNQPQRNGVWCTGVETATGKLLWREQVADYIETDLLDSNDRKLKARAMRIKTKVVSVDGNDVLFAQFDYKIGRGNGREKGGSTFQPAAFTANPDKSTLNPGPIMDISNFVAQTTIDGNGCGITHAGLFISDEGVCESPQAGVNLVCPNHNDNASKGTLLKMVVNPDGSLTYNGSAKLAEPVAGQNYAKTYGNNPKNQGREFVFFGQVDNPYKDVPGEFFGLDKINVGCYTGKVTDDTNLAMKPDVICEVFSSMNCNEGTKTGPVGGDTVGGKGGCSAGTGLSGSAALVLLGFALVGLRRRRQASN